MAQDSTVDSSIDVLGRLIVKKSVRSLFNDFCSEVTRFSDRLSRRFTRFEISFYSAEGILLKITPYSELFLVSIGENPTINVRVSDREGFIRSLDLSLKHYLDFLSGVYK